MFKILIFAAVVLCTVSTEHIKTSSDNSFEYTSGDFKITLSNVDQKTVYEVKKFGRVLQRVYLDENFKENLSKTEITDGFILHGSGQNIEFKVVQDSIDFSLLKVSRTINSDQTAEDCIDLKTGHLNWFGGPEIWNQYWPVEKLRLKDYSYVTKQQDNVGVAERYWLNSKGSFIYVDEKAPLFLNQNVDGNTLCFVVKNELPYNTRRTSIKFDYHLGFAPDPKLAQLKAVNEFLKKPTGTPDRRMVEHPIWSTWARFKSNINESAILQFASEIEKYGFNNSQLEIDDKWEVCYGSLTVNQTRFKDMRNLTDGLRARGFRVTAWIHPFINKGCDPWYSKAKELGYLVTNHDGNPDTQWWQSKENEAGHIDFTNPDAAEWYVSRLKTLQEEAGIDCFKFDAGETSYVPPDPKLNASLEDHPFEIQNKYLRAVSQFGPIVEVRSAHRTQDLPIFLRYQDKDTSWTFESGLPTLVTTLLQLNLVGYGFILPDMIGGNGYDGNGVEGNIPPSEELFIRWLEASVFMPSLQYSYVPWDYQQSTIDISKKYTNLHNQYANEIMAAFERTVETGEPVNPPIWWLDPHDEVAFGIDDEFLLGEKILAAPVLRKGEDFRHIYLPRGKWYDPNLNKTHTGPTWLMKYPAKLDVLPYFIRDPKP